MKHYVQEYLCLILQKIFLIIFFFYFSEKITKAPGIASAPNVSDPDLIVIATNTQLSNTEIQRLSELVVTVLNNISHFRLLLVSGLNMISLPLDTGHNFTAKSFAQYLVNSGQGRELDSDLDLSLIHI